MPVNALLIRALTQLHTFYGDDFRVECPTGSGTSMTLWQVAQEIARRLISIFVPGADGKRPVHGGVRMFQEDPDWRDLLLFYEYFHGDNGAGIGASHQTGWTAIVAGMICLFTEVSGSELLRRGPAAIERAAPEQPHSPPAVASAGRT